jgi:hypothetical protein
MRFITIFGCIRRNAFFSGKEDRLIVANNSLKRQLLSPQSSNSMGNCLDIRLRCFGIVFEQNIRIADTSNDTRNIS